MNSVKRYFNQQGSIFVFVLMMMTVLIMLGSAVLMAATTNYTMNAASINAGRSFHRADGWVEEINKLLEEKTILVQKKAKDDADSMKEAIIDRYSYTDPLTGEVDIDYRSIENALQIEYRDAFNKYITGHNDLESGKTLEELLEDRFALWKDSSPSDLQEIRIESVSPYPDKDEGAGLDSQMAVVDTPVKIEFQIDSNFAGAPKSIRAQFEFLKYSQQVPLKMSLVRKKNPIYMRAITTESSLVAVGGEVNIQGSGGAATNVYAYGNLPPDNSSGYGYGGVVAGAEPQIINTLGIAGVSAGSGTLNIRGTARTRAYVHTVYGADGDSSSINITGDTYCESLQIEDQSENSTIEIGQNLYTYDDIRANGSNGQIIVNGNFYGFMDGGGSSNEYNKSSSIIINDTTSNVEVKGEAYIGGKVYIEYIYVNPEGVRIPYKTGESVSIGRNYDGYRRDLSIGKAPGYISDPGIGDEQGDFDPSWIPYGMYWGMDKEGLLTDEDRVQRMANPNNDNNNRKNHFFQGYKDSEAFRNYMKKTGIVLGDNSVSNPIMKVYAPGIIFSDGYMICYGNGNAQAISADGAVFEDVDGDGVLQFPAGGKIKMVMLYQPGDFITNKTRWEKAYNKAIWIQQDKDYSRYKDLTISSDSEFHELTAQRINASNRYHNLDDSDSDYYFIDTGGADVHLDGSRLDGKSGIIFTTGNLYISSNSEMDFTGAIVSKGNIVFYGSGAKTITYDETAVKEVVNKDDTLKNFFKKGNKIIELEPEDVELGIQATKNIRLDYWREVD